MLCSNYNVNPSTKAFLLSESHKSVEVYDGAVSILRSFEIENYSLATVVQEVLLVRVLTFLNIFQENRNTNTFYLKSEIGRIFYF